MSAFRTAVTACLTLAVCVAGGPATAAPFGSCAGETVRPTAPADPAPHACCGTEAASVGPAAPAHGCCGEDCRCDAPETASERQIHICGCGSHRPAPVAPEPAPRQVASAVDGPPAERPEDVLRPRRATFVGAADVCVRSSRFAQRVLSVWLT